MRCGEIEMKRTSLAKRHPDVRADAGEDGFVDTRQPPGEYRFGTERLHMNNLEWCRCGARYIGNILGPDSESDLGAWRKTWRTVSGKNEREWTKLNAPAACVVGDDCLDQIHWWITEKSGNESVGW